MNKEEKQAGGAAAPGPGPDERTVSDPSSHTLPMSRREILTNYVIKQRAFLQVNGPSGGEQTIELGAEPVSLGRSGECTVRLLLPGVSRVHARVYFRSDEYHLEDLNSTNGSFVNTIRVSECVLRNNDVIEIGEAKIHFVEQQSRQ